jgi:SAM-dependent methyltransferase
MAKTLKYRFIKISHKINLFGLNPIVFFRSIFGFFFIIRDYYNLKKQKGKDSSFYFGSFYPVLSERFSDSGTMSGHYFHQDLYVASRIFINNPIKHLDIGSRTDGFVAHLAVFREVEIIDIRDQISKVKNINFRKADLMKLPEDLIEEYDSISSLHAIEHFGLGRYGDPIDYNGHLKAIENILKILKVGGKFYFSVPIGSQRIEFNAHRVFSLKYLLEILDKYFKLELFSFVDDFGDFHENIDLTNDKINSNCECYYGCGIFELTKR